MYSLVFVDGTESAIQMVYWTILIIFFVLVVLSWLVASKDWFKEEAVNAETHPERSDPENNKQS